MAALSRSLLNFVEEDSKDDDEARPVTVEVNPISPPSPPLQLNFIFFTLVAPIPALFPSFSSRHDPLFIRRRSCSA